MSKKLNIICSIISFIPILILFVYYNSIKAFTNTKIYGTNGIIVSKINFIFVIIISCLIWYYLSFLISDRMQIIHYRISNYWIRIFLNIIFITISVILIFSNIQLFQSLLFFPHVGLRQDSSHHSAFGKLFQFSSSARNRRMNLLNFLFKQFLLIRLLTGNSIKLQY